MREALWELGAWLWDKWPFMLRRTSRRWLKEERESSLQSAGYERARHRDELANQTLKAKIKYEDMRDTFLRMQVEDGGLLDGTRYIRFAITLSETILHHRNQKELFDLLKRLLAERLHDALHLDHSGVQASGHGGDYY